MNFSTSYIRYRFTTLFFAAVILASACSNPVTEQPNIKNSKPTEVININTLPSINETKTLKVNVVAINGARESTLLKQVLSRVDELYQRCRITLQFDTKEIDLAAESVIDSDTRSQLAGKYKNSMPTIFFVSKTAENDVAFAYLPRLNTTSSSTVWITDRVSENCLTWISAHELGHVLLNNGKHSNGSVNVMSNGCTLNNWNNSAAAPTWTAEQCSALHLSPFLVH